MVRQDEEAPLVHHVSVSLDDEGMVLIAIVLGQVAIALEELLPVDRQLTLNKVEDTELHWLHSALLRHRIEND